MQITITENENNFYKETASRIAEVIREKPEAKIGLSTGRTTKGVHKALTELYQEAPFCCDKVKIFGIDEITNMSRECKASCYYILLHEVILPLGIPMENYIMPDPFAEDFKEECRSFEEKVEKDGGPDLVILGLGENGHLGFNQPGTPFGTTTWLSYMDDSLDERLRRENNIPADVKMGGLTLGIKNLMQCKRLVMAANGENKTKVAEQMIYGPVTENLPASILQLHSQCEVILDPLAAKTISARSHKKDVYQIMAQKGICLPEAASKGGLYERAKFFGKNLVYVSGCGPVTDKPITGKLGSAFGTEEGMAYARAAMLNLLAALETAAGDLNRVKSVVKVLCFVASEDDFYEQPRVADGGTGLLKEIFGEEGIPTRSAIGVNVLPGNIPVEIEGIFEIEED